MVAEIWDLHEPIRRAAGAAATWIHAKKKSFVATEKDTPENRARREEFCRLLEEIEPHHLVFIDESFVKTGLRREYARAPRGQRVTGPRPFRSWKTITVIGAIRLGEKPRLMTSARAVTGPTFLRFVKRTLAPWIYPGDVVVMDNLNVHRMEAVREAIRDAGGVPVFLPTYSPELNPIECLWADWKRRLRTLAVDAHDELLRTIRRLRAATPTHKIAAWFRRSFTEAQVKRSPG